jgi:hypothetical protein
MRWRYHLALQAQKMSHQGRSHLQERNAPRSVGNAYIATDPPRRAARRGAAWKTLEVSYSNLPDPYKGACA